MKALVKKILYPLTAAGLSLAIMTAPAFAGKPKWADKSSDSIVEFAAGASGGLDDLDDNGEDFDILIAALLATGAVATFNGDDFTVFAPNDAAFYALTGKENDTDAFTAAVDLLGVDGVAAVLAYHVTEGVRNSMTVTRAKKITMLDGNTVSGRSGNIEANFSTAGFVDDGTNNRLSDGMVHIIDTVLLPINPAAL